ncbi:MAG: hypothetical protein OXU61_10625 [Gammaproteobacteria bacterium]|nr:hypothetical protein [Gammaproteobacteria bacterium]
MLSFNGNRRILAQYARQHEAGSAQRSRYCARGTEKRRRIQIAQILKAQNQARPPLPARGETEKWLKNNRQIAQIGPGDWALLGTAGPPTAPETGFRRTDRPPPTRLAARRLEPGTALRLS